MRFGANVNSPVFAPFVGAVVILRISRYQQQRTDERTQAKRACVKNNSDLMYHSGTHHQIETKTRPADFSFKNGVPDGHKVKSLANEVVATTYGTTTTLIFCVLGCSFDRATLYLCGQSTFSLYAHTYTWYDSKEYTSYTKFTTFVHN